MPPGKEQRKLNFPKKAGKDPETCAEAADVKIQSELNSGTYIDPAAGKITLEQYARQWRANLTGKQGTLQRVDDRLAHIYEVAIPEGRHSRRMGDSGSTIAGMTMSLLSKRPSAIQQWIKELESKGLAAGYVGNIVDMLSSIFIAAIDDGVVHKNPTKARSVNKPPVRSKRIVPWTPAQVRAAGSSLAKGKPKGRNRLMADLGAGGGMRQGEIFGIGQDDIEMLKRKVNVRRQVKLVHDKSGKPHLVFGLPKGDKERAFPLSDTLGLRVAAHIEEFPSVTVTLPWEKPDGPPHTVRLLFIRQSGKPYHRQDFGYVWHRARVAAGVPETRENGMHVLRHTAASAWLAAGVDVRKVADYLGHDDPGFTLRTYIHFMPEGEETARKAMDQFFADEEPSAPDVPQEGSG
jgi:integrase